MAKGKKLSPSGYVIINIPSDDLDLDNGVLLRNSEDSKTFYELFKNHKLLNKPIILKLADTYLFYPQCTNGDVICTMVDYDADLHINQLETFTFYYDSEEDKIYFRYYEM